MILAEIDMAAFDRAMEPIVRAIPPETAKRIAAYQADSKLASRIEYLASKCNEGELTEEERAEYAGYAKANKFVAILQTQVRKILAAKAS